eukprot:GHVP01066042.1.p1 GENE.GHVP01066042.1~~GHVP01066042.1.p1  ORF type:complete len:349 (+),score=56.82 GHVP01066042.1:25-1071(+)
MKLWNLEILFLVHPFLCEAYDETLLHFSDAFASSTNPGIQTDEFSAKKALEPGTGYWCSQGNHPDDEVISWTGQFHIPVTVAGLKIHWAYSPEYVEVSLGTNNNKHVAIPWRATTSTLESFEEYILFPRLERVSEIQLSFKHATHGFIGLHNIIPIGSDDGLVFIVAGVSSGVEQCLQVDAGQMSKEEAMVVIDDCHMALAAGDGREIWQWTDVDQLQAIASNPPKCMTLLDGNVTKGGTIGLAECSVALESGDGRSLWEPQGNSQIRLHKEGSYCLSLEGGEIGNSNIAKGSSIKSTSSMDNKHKVENLLDGNSNTFWASKSFENPTGIHPVTLVIDFGDDATHVYT